MNLMNFTAKRIVSILLPILALFADVPSVNAADVRPEYPRPDFERSDWVNLNGTWTYTLDQSLSGHEKNYQASTGFDGKITVPFAPESSLSGVGFKDFINGIWYQREVSVPSDWQGKEILLHFGAIYYNAEVYINGQLAALHRGGSAPVNVNITPYVTPGQNANIVVCATSDLRSQRQGAGKQSLRHDSNGCNYTRTTGIWQTVWLEAVAPGSLKDVKVSTDLAQKQIVINPTFYPGGEGRTLKVELLDGNRTVSRASVDGTNQSVVVLPVKSPKLWSPESPFLYDVVYTVEDSDGKVIDTVKSYVGMRSIDIRGNKLYLNGEPYFQRLVLDQGFYPDGIWTAPTDEALRHDIEMSKAAGFNGARLHQKVFEPRYHYWADKLGYITWGEAPSWGMDANDEIAAYNFLSEWSDIIARDTNHPSIVIWTPLNEEWWPDTRNYPRFVTSLYDLTKQLDPTRPVNDASGGCHVKTDIWTVHTYEQDPAALSRQLYDPERSEEYAGRFMQLSHARGVTIPNIGFNTVATVDYPFPAYDGKMPFLVDEFGGIKWTGETTDGDASAWGYGEAPKTAEEFLSRLAGQVDAVVSLGDHIAGYCYTQLTDVEQEQNGLYFYDRRPKFDTATLYGIFSKSPEYSK